MRFSSSCAHCALAIFAAWSGKVLFRRRFGTSCCRCCCCWLVLIEFSCLAGQRIFRNYMRAGNCAKEEGRREKGVPEIRIQIWGKIAQVSSKKWTARKVCWTLFNCSAKYFPFSLRATFTCKCCTNFALQGIAVCVRVCVCECVYTSVCVRACVCVVCASH